MNIRICDPKKVLYSNRPLLHAYCRFTHYIRFLLFSLFTDSISAITDIGITYPDERGIAGYDAERMVAEGGIRFFVDSILLMRLQQFYSL